jgi:ParB family chromosome partitioning protein
MLTTIRLGNLSRSDLNVRKTDPAADIVTLADDIHRRGLKQNLVVEPHADRPGCYVVVAGGRRLEALWNLVDRELMSLDAEIPALIEQVGEGRETSLAENIQRVAMNPADELEAFATIVREHADQPDPIAYCAGRFGKTVRYVEERLHLAELAPDILAALRDGRIGIKAAEAYASVADHDVQLKVFAAEEKRYGGRHEPRNIRDGMKARTYPVGIAQALYVGIDAYMADGGRVGSDLFMGDDQGGELILDPSKLDTLARKKAAQELETIAPADGFASGLLVQGFGLYPNWPPAPAGYERAWGDADRLKGDKRAAAIGVYHLKDGALACAGWFKPRQSAEETAAARQRDQNFWREQQRDRAVRCRAAALAASRLDVADLRERLIFEPDDYLEEEDDGSILVSVQVRLTADEVAALKAEAETAYAAEQAAAEQPEAAAA